jgi:hypothetical protein
MDVVTAFLPNLLDEEMYMEQPERFTEGRIMFAGWKEVCMY